MHADPPLILVTEIGGGAEGLDLALGLAVTLSRNGRAALVCGLGGPQPKASLLASPSARELALVLSRGDPAFESSAASGHIVRTVLPPESASLDLIAGFPTGAPAPAAIVVHVPAAMWPEAVEHGLKPMAAVLRASLPRDRALAALWTREVRGRGVRARVIGRPLGRLAARCGRVGVAPPGSDGRLLRRLASRAFPQGGQALPILVAAMLTLVLSVSALAAVVGAATGKGRAQRAADLAAVSAARSMRDDFHRLFVPLRKADGTLDPSHLEKRAYLRRAELAAIEAARRNGVRPGHLAIGFPDRRSEAPLRVRVTLSVGAGAEAGPAAIEAEAEAAPAGAPDPGSGAPSKGGYSGPLTFRQGKPMRPDVARAFDRMAARAHRAGVELLVSSGYRSDAEQARLFAEHPDPRWVAPPGRSLHRCGTELDLGPPAAYGWLAANAPRFGFVRRYSWEPWHFGYSGGRRPCSTGEALGDGDAASPSRGLPAFVPPRFRDAIQRASARWNVPAGLLAAQLMAESNFNPFAVSPAGAGGIAQFMPATAASYGLADRFDPDASIDAQGHLMADLIRRFGRLDLALAAYNAGADAVRRYGGMPPYAETRSYVARILGLMGGAGELAVPTLEVRLIS